MSSNESPSRVLLVAAWGNPYTNPYTWYKVHYDIELLVGKYRY